MGSPALIIMKRLGGACQAVSDVTSVELDTMFELFQRYYRNAGYDQFYRDFREKDDVIILKDEETGRMRGFSTLATYTMNTERGEIDILFSGDTIIDRAYWGQQELVKSWCSYVGQRFGGTERPAYWFLISKGYRTYLYLPLFFKEFYPRWDMSTPSHVQALLDRFARQKYSDAYADGLIRFAQPRDALRQDLAEIAPQRLKNPHVNYFLQRNPEYQRGDELACIAPLHAENLRSLAAFHFKIGQKHAMRLEVA
jgi:hypothetical protein